MPSTPPSVLVIGRTGQLGSALARAAWPAHLAPQFQARRDLDLTRPDEIRAHVIAARPRFVVNAAAYTAVDEAESARDLAFAVNRNAPAALAEACRSAAATLVQISTDYVFDGRKPTPYEETDATAPLSVYGASKEAGERAVRDRLDRHVILRTSWVYAPAGRNFLSTMLRLGAERDRLAIVADQHGAPTAAADLADAVLAVLGALADGRDGGYGTFHFCGQGETSWYGFAEAIFAGARARGARVPRDLVPIPTEAYPTPARRPRNSRLDCAKIGRVYGIAARPWRDALSGCLDAILGPVPLPSG